jgi:hypothetical protein
MQNFPLRNRVGLILPVFEVTEHSKCFRSGIRPDFDVSLETLVKGRADCFFLIYLPADSEKPLILPRKIFL